MSTTDKQGEQRTTTLAETDTHIVRLHKRIDNDDRVTWAAARVQKDSPELGEQPIGEWERDTQNRWALGLEPPRGDDGSERPWGYPDWRDAVKGLVHG